MQFNGLKLNGEKTELLVVIAQHRPRPEINHLQVSNECIQPTTSARNIGVMFDQDVSLEQHVVSVFKVCFFIFVTFPRLETASRNLTLKF